MLYNDAISAREIIRRRMKWEGERQLIIVR
jgi:hypothetical protein